MIDFDHYDNLKKTSIVPERIRDMFVDDGEIGKVLVDICLPTLRVVIYAATHEPQLFSDLLEKMKQASNLPPYFHKRLYYNELFPCLCLLGDECLKCLLSELDCSDSVFNGLRDSVLKPDSDAFEKVMQEWNGSSSRITPICNLLSLEIFIAQIVERIIQEANRIDEIKDLDQQNREGMALVRNAKNVISMKVKYVLSNEIDNELNISLDKAFNECFDSPSNLDNECVSDCFKDDLRKGVLLVNPNAKVEIIDKAPEDFIFKMLLLAYDFLATETSISTTAKEVIKEILFVPEYESIWKQYEDSGSIDSIEKEVLLLVETPQIEEHQPFFIKGTTENKDEKQFANKWPLPDDFFEPAYIDDDCSIEEYFPEFLQNLLLFDGKNDQGTKFSKEELKEISGLFSEFISKLASNGYITDDNDTKLALAHALTGRRVKSSVKRVKWSKPTILPTQNDHINSICFLITWLYPRHISDLKSKYEHVLTVFGGLEGTKPATNAGVNVKKSPIKKIVKSFLDGLKECAPIVNNENLDLLMKEFEEEYGEN